MKFRYRFRDEPWNEIEADSYEILDGSTKCKEYEEFIVRTSHDLIYACPRPAWSCGQRSCGSYAVGSATAWMEYFVSTGTYQEGFGLDSLRLSFTAGNNPEFGVVTSGYKLLYDRQYEGTIEATQISPGSYSNNATSPPPLCPNGQGAGWVIPASSIVIANIRPPFESTDFDCKKCIVRFYKDNILIKQVGDTVCPQIQGDGCPPGTCQVDCGSVWCCYGSDGIAVNSFSK